MTRTVVRMTALTGTWVFLSTRAKKGEKGRPPSRAKAYWGSRIKPDELRGRLGKSERFGRTVMRELPVKIPCEAKAMETTGKTWRQSEPVTEPACREREVQ